MCAARRHGTVVSSAPAAKSGSLRAVLVGSLTKLLGAQPYNAWLRHGLTSRSSEGTVPLAQDHIWHLSFITGRIGARDARCGPRHSVARVGWVTLLQIGRSARRSLEGRARRFLGTRQEVMNQRLAEGPRRKGSPAVDAPSWSPRSARSTLPGRGAKQARAAPGLLPFAHRSRIRTSGSSYREPLHATFAAAALRDVGPPVSHLGEGAQSCVGQGSATLAFSGGELWDDLDQALHAQLCVLAPVLGIHETGFDVVAQLRVQHLLL